MEQIKKNEFGRTVTLTPDEASKLMRDAGIKISTETLRDGIEQGVFNFGFCVQQDKRNFFISRKQLLEWLDSFGGQVPDTATLNYGQ